MYRAGVRREVSARHGACLLGSPPLGRLVRIPSGSQGGSRARMRSPSRYLSRTSGRLRLRVQNRRTPHEAGDCGRAGRARCPCPRDVRFPLNAGGVKQCQYRDASSSVNGGKCARELRTFNAALCRNRRQGVSGLGPETRARAVRANGGGTRKGVGARIGAGPETSGRFQILSCYLGRTLRQSRQIGPVPAVRIIGKNPQSSSSTSDLAMKWT